ncbi:acyltransferase family protein [Dyadobacter sp. 3J3]|uniref:acyltransferase family protein n=1 Tax=Dyadobacter sp. 3J3 TaxID=2606600 RepID=UPI001E481FC0|nr:acyltransferase family protein [Dyadobacter sp. 3J3]
MAIHKKIVTIKNIASNTIQAHSARRYDLDWLRVIAFVILIFFHVGMFFNSWGWHIKNNEISHVIELPMRFTSMWRMALLFMISGAGVYFALENRSPKSFLSERFIRIFIPLLFGMFVIVPPQIFFERLTQGEAYSYGAFYKTVFQFHAYPHGNFSWHHLWYLVDIFFYSLLSLPLFLFIKKRPQMTANWARFFSNPFVLIFVPVIWHFIGEEFLSDKFPNTNNLIHDWNNHFHSLTLFICGFILCTQTAFWETIVKYRKLTLSIWIVITIILYSAYWLSDREVAAWEPVFYSIIKTTNAWCILLSFLGYAYVYLQFTNRFLKYANEAVYPFYILHQTVIVCLAYPIIHSALPIGVKFGYLSIATFLICLVLYHFMIRRFNILRFLFGLKPIKTKAEKVTQELEIPISLKS